MRILEAYGSRSAMPSTRLHPFRPRQEVAIPEEGSPVFQLKENVTLTSNHPEYLWVNPIQVWAPGTVDVSKGEIRIKAYAV